jgi:hypothetical protein
MDHSPRLSPEGYDHPQIQQQTELCLEVVGMDAMIQERLKNCSFGKKWLTMKHNHSSAAYMPAAIILCDSLDKELDNNSSKENRNQEITAVQQLFESTVKILECCRRFLAREECRFLSPLQSPS